MKYLKKLVTCITAGTFSVMLALPTYAGTWQKLGEENWQYKYVEDDGGFTTNDWQLIDGKWYHFKTDGFLDIGLCTIDGKQYHLMNSGALETNHDYGFAACDADGIWSVKEYSNGADDNIYNDYCKQYGINIDFGALFSNSTYIISCTGENLPKDSEGNYAEYVTAQAIINAIARHSNTEGVERAPYNYSGGYDSSTGIFTLTLTTSDGSRTILKG